MRKKQLLAFLMAGALTVGMTPYAAFAAEGIDTEAVEVEASEETGDVTEAPEEVPTEAPTEAPAEEPTEAPAEEVPTEAPAEETPAEPTAVPQAEAVETPAEAETGTAKITNEDGSTTYTSLQEAITAATDGTATKILVTGDLELDGTVTVAAGKQVSVLANAADTNIKRAEGFNEDLFSVEGDLTFGVNEGSAGTLTIDGEVTDSSAVTGSLVNVVSGKFTLTDGVNLTGNTKNGKGGAIDNEGTGTVALNGGFITGNTAEQGGGIYSTATLQVQSDAKVSGNKDTSDEDNNVELNGTVIEVAGAMTSDAGIALNAENEAAGIQVVKIADGVTDVTLADVKDYFAYDHTTYSIGEDGKLASAAEVTPTPTPTGDFVLTKVSSTWPKSSSFQYVFTSSRPGTFYTTYVERGAAAPSFSEKYPSGKIDLGEEQRHTEKGLDTSKNYDFYVWVKDADGNVSDALVISPGFAIKGENMEWRSSTSVRVEFNSSRAGDYYVKVVEKGKAPGEFTSSDKVGVVTADENQAHTVTDLSVSKDYDVYVCVVDSTGDHSNIVKFQTYDAARPTPEVSPTPTHTPVTPVVTDSVVKGLENPLQFYPGTFYNFTVTGAGTENSNPGEGDVKWVPLYWSTSSNPSSTEKNTSWRIGSTNGISQEATYNMYVFFQKQVYSGTEWQATDTIESVTYQFKSAALTATTTVTPTGTGSGTDTGTGTDGTTANGTTTSTGTTAGTTSTATSVSTADESPIGSMLMLAAVSMLAGGYVIVRKRKKS